MQRTDSRDAAEIFAEGIWDSLLPFDRAMGRVYAELYRPEGIPYQVQEAKARHVYLISCLEVMQANRDEHWLDNAAELWKLMGDHFRQTWLIASDLLVLRNSALTLRECIRHVEGAMANYRQYASTQAHHQDRTRVWQWLAAELPDRERERSSEDVQFSRFEMELARCLFSDVRPGKRMRDSKLLKELRREGNCGRIAVLAFINSVFNIGGAYECIIKPAIDATLDGPEWLSDSSHRSNVGTHIRLLESLQPDESLAQADQLFALITSEMKAAFEMAQLLQAHYDSIKHGWKESRDVSAAADVFAIARDLHQKRDAARVR